MAWMTVAVGITAAVALVVERRTAVDCALTVEAAEPRLERLARAHRAWVGEHGAGCARGLDHLVRYAPDAIEPDRWGAPLVFECARTPESVQVIVRSLGPDGVLGGDDVVGRDRQAL